MQELVEVLAKALVEKPEEVQVKVYEVDDLKQLKICVAPDDTGRIIGKKGRIIKAIRTIVASAATRRREKVEVDVE